MTERLYYHDSFLREFDATVLACDPDPEHPGERWRVVLDRTGFYPTSGGQPHDTGRLGSADVVEVADSEDGHGVVHYTSAAVKPGPVRGTIDWPRRIDHMQQHTGQHLLSAAFIELFGFPTVSFHLGREVSTIDLEAASIVPRHLDEAERRTNEIIFEDRVVAVRFGTAEELAEAGIRKKVDRRGVLRAVEVDGFDRQPCGGTHLARTGQAGVLLIRKLERRREAWRVEFVCGFRALAAARGDFTTLTQTASLLSCGLPEVPGVIAKTIDERRMQHARAKRLEERLAEFEARALVAQGTTGADDRRVVAAVLDDATPAYLGLLAAKIVAEGNVVALLAGRTTGHVVFAQSKGGNADLGSLLGATLREFGGKGGGAKDFAQGSVPKPSDADAIVARSRERLGSVAQNRGA
ncbi:MAG TPA: DHHA1 domain-containing protein [Candidatus Cybelea sp.]|nr:DHHA1 domain-containing protein [Candidatus Cybelea sp.]